MKLLTPISVSSDLSVSTWLLDDVSAHWRTLNPCVYQDVVHSPAVVRVFEGDDDWDMLDESLDYSHLS